MSREYLENIKSENRLDKIRIIKKNDPVIGGQPNDKEDAFTSNTPLLDLACTLKFAVDEIDSNKNNVTEDLKEIRESLDTKAEKNDVDSALNLKADQAEVERELKLKADESTMLDELEKKINKADIANTVGTAKDKVASQFLISELQKALEQAIKDSTPVGTTSFYVGETAPNDQWLIMRGQKYDTAKYPELYAMLKSDTLPDGRGVALRGLDAGRGFDPARKLLSYQQDAMQPIVGMFWDLAASRVKEVTMGTADGAFTYANLKNNAIHASTGGTTSDTGDGIKLDSSLVTRTNSQNETVMKNLALNIIIKVK